MAGIFHDASIGNAIHVILVRLILLQGEEVTVKDETDDKLKRGVKDICLVVVKA